VPDERAPTGHRHDTRPEGGVSRDADKYHPVTDPGRSAYWLVVGEVFRSGRKETADLRKPEERERMAEEEWALKKEDE
jgi:hypothetical protein